MTVFLWWWFGYCGGRGIVKGNENNNDCDSSVRFSCSKIYMCHFCTNAEDIVEQKPVKNTH